MLNISYKTGSTFFLASQLTADLLPAYLYR